MTNLFESMNGNYINNLKNQIINIQKNFNGNPKDMIMQKLNSGQITQAQLNQAQSKATEIMKFLKW
jgi:hypothetical protein